MMNPTSGPGAASLLVMALLSACAGEDALPEPAETAEPPVQRVPGPVPPTAPSRGCDDRRVVVLDGNRVERVDADGNRTLLFAFGATEGVAPENVVVDRLMVEGGHVAAYALLFRPGLPHLYEHVLLRPDGTTAWHVVEQEPYNPSSFLSDDGTLAVSSSTGRVVTPDGRVRTLPGLFPLGPARGGRLPVTARPHVERVRAGVLDLADTDSEVTWLGEVTWHGVQWAGPVLVALVEQDGAMELVAVPPDGMRRMSVDAGAWLTSVAPSGHVLLTSGVDASVHLVDTRNGTRTRVTLPTAPTHHRGELQLDTDGAVLAMDLDEVTGTVGVVRSADGGATWTALGARASFEALDIYGGGVTFRVLRRADTWAVATVAVGYGHFLQRVEAVRPDASLAVMGAGGLYMPYNQPEDVLDLSADGRCMAVWTHPQDEHLLDPVAVLRLMDVETGNSRVLVDGAAAVTARLLP